MKLGHSIKLFFKRIKWYFDLLHYARSHHSEVESYKFLMKIKDETKNKCLDFERSGYPEEDLIGLKAQLEIIDRIINYVNK